MDPIHFMISATIVVVLLRLGFNVLDKIEVSNLVSPVVMSIFKHCLAITACYSSTSHIVFHLQVKISFSVIVVFTLLYNPGSELLAYFYFILFTCNNFIIFFAMICRPRLTDKLKLFILSFLIHLSVRSSIDLVGEKTMFFPYAVLFVSLIFSVSFVLSISNTNMVALIKFTVGMVGTICFHSFFRSPSFDQVMAFIYFAGAWVANLLLLEASDDFGIFSFLLSNLIVCYTVLEFGLEFSSWLAYGASLLLFTERLSIWLRRVQVC